MRKITEIKEIVKNRLNELMEENNITENTDLARKTGIDRNDIGDYRNENKLPTTKNLIKLADFFGVSTSYLLGETDVRTADDIIIGNELGIDDTTLNNLKEIKKINQKYNNEYQDILRDIFTDVELYNTIMEKIDLYVRYYSDTAYKKEFDSINKLQLVKMNDYIDFNMTQEIENKVEFYLYRLQAKNMVADNMDEYWAPIRIKSLQREIRNIKEALKGKSQK